jgi:hypothetical protein
VEVSTEHSIKYAKNENVIHKPRHHSEKLTKTVNAQSGNHESFINSEDNILKLSIQNCKKSCTEFAHNFSRLQVVTSMLFQARK